MNTKLHERTLHFSKQIKITEAKLIECLIETDRTKNFAYYEVNSLFEYCTKVLKLSADETFRFTQVARKSVKVPALKEAIEEGLLTVSMASRIAPVITTETQGDWINKAITLKQRDLQREVAKENPKAPVKENLRVLTEELSSFQVTFTKEEEELLKRAQEVLKQTTLKDTLLYALKLTLKHKDPVEKAKRQSPASRQVKPKVVPVTKVGRTPIPASILHQVNLRDKGMCQEKGCGSRYWTQYHHIIEVSKGGKHELSNISTLCSLHHSMRHHFQSQNYRKYTPGKDFTGDRRRVPVARALGSGPLHDTGREI